MRGGGWRTRGAGRGERTDGGVFIVGIFIVCRKANKVDEERARDGEKMLSITGALQCAEETARKLLPAKYDARQKEGKREREKGGRGRISRPTICRARIKQR